jgi:hypothetical protein
MTKKEKKMVLYEDCLEEINKSKLAAAIED